MHMSAFAWKKSSYFEMHSEGFGSCGSAAERTLARLDEIAKILDTDPLDCETMVRLAKTMDQPRKQTREVS